MKKERFEDYLNEVEKIVAELEEGNLSLEESLSHYESGIKSLKKCYEILDNLEKRIELLVKDDQGRLQAKPFRPPKAGPDHD